MTLLAELEEVARDRFLDHRRECAMCAFVERLGETDLLCQSGRELLGTWLLSLAHWRDEEKAS